LSAASVPWTWPRSSAAAAPDSQAGYDTVDRLRDRVHAIPGADAKVGGGSAVTLDIQRASRHDRNLVVPLVLGVVLVILALVLRAVVAPLLLVATVVLSFAAALGVSALAFEYVFDFAGSDPAFPLWTFVFLVALGTDYNIFLMTRVHEESKRHGTRRGALIGLAATGGVITSEDDGCGCAYPDYISDDVVERSNQIMTRLRATAGRFPELVSRLDALPRYLTASVGGQPIGVLHGDPESLAGWRLALEAMEPGDPLVRRQVGWHGPPTTAADLLDWFGRAEVSVFACTHTGLPYAQDLTDRQGRRRLVINNGSAGLPSFTGTTFGVITRLSTNPQPPADSLYGTTLDGLRCDALPLEFDLASWLEHLRRSGRKAVPPPTATSSASRAAPSCGSTKPSAA
jgi:hypothetical protein